MKGTFLRCVISFLAASSSIPVYTQKLTSDSLYFAPEGASQGGKPLLFNARHINSKLFPEFFGSQQCPGGESWLFQSSHASTATPGGHNRDAASERTLAFSVLVLLIVLQALQPALIAVHCLP